jgi:hypothetical protein
MFNSRPVVFVGVIRSTVGNTVGRSLPCLVHFPMNVSFSGTPGDLKPESLNFFSSYLLLSSQELSDTKVYEPKIRALLGTAQHLCEVVVLQLKTVPILISKGLE